MQRAAVDPGQFRPARLDLFGDMPGGWSKFADHVFRAVTQHPLRPGVEHGDEPLKVRGDDGDLGGGVEHLLDLCAGLAESHVPLAYDF